MIITLTTDIGWKYAAEIKGRILSIDPDAKIVDISHHILPRNVMQGAFVLYSKVPYFTNVVHMGVVDPRVGTERKAIIIECDHVYFVGPDNGLLIPAAKKLGIKKVYKIQMEGDTSPIFYGRDVFAPAAAKISMGSKAGELGRKIRKYVDLDFGECIVKGELIKGKVLFIDRFGNIVTNIREEHLQAEEFEVKIGIIEKKVRTYPSYGFAEKGEIHAVIGSSGFLQIAKREGNAAEYFGAREEKAIEILF